MVPHIKGAASLQHYCVSLFPELERAEVHPFVDEAGELVEAEQVERQFVHQLLHLPRDGPHLARRTKFRKRFPLNMYNHVINY